MANNETQFKTELIKDYLSSHVHCHASSVSDRFHAGRPDMYVKHPEFPGTWFELKFTRLSKEQANKYGVRLLLSPPQRKFLEKHVSKDASVLMIDILKKQQVNDRLPRYLGDGIQIAHKTGDGQPWVANDAGILWVKGQPIVIVVFAGHHRGSANELQMAEGRIAAIVVKHYGGDVDPAGLERYSSETSLRRPASAYSRRAAMPVGTAAREGRMTNYLLQGGTILFMRA